MSKQKSPARGKTPANVTTLANAGTPLHKWDNNPQEGKVYALSNVSSLFQASHLSEPLTAYALGFKDPNDPQELTNFVAPPVMVPRRFQWRKAVDGEAFFTEIDDERAIGGSFKEVAYSGDVQDSSTQNRGLFLRIDKDELPDGAEEAYIQQRTGWLVQRLKRGQANRAFTLLDATATAASGKTWHIDGTAANPDQDIEDELLTAGDSLGMRPNRILSSVAAWNLRNRSYDAQDRAAAARSNWTRQQVADWMDIDEWRVSRQRIVTAEGGSKSRLVSGNVLYMFYAEPTPNTDDASVIKRFWTPCESGGEFAVYRQETGVKFIDITVECYDRFVACHTLGIRKITAAAS